MNDIDGDFVLIKLVKERPILWDKKCFDVHERNREWEIIGNFFNKTASWVKYRWMKLRQRFVKSLKFNKTNLNNVGNFTYFQDMLFLIENIQLRKPKKLINDNIFIKLGSKSSDDCDDDDNNEFLITENDMEEIDNNDQNESEDIFKELSDDDENNTKEEIDDNDQNESEDIFKELSDDDENNTNDITEKLSYIDNNDLVEDKIEEYVQNEEGEKINQELSMKSDSTETLHVKKLECFQEQNIYIEQLFDVEYLTKNVNDNEEAIEKVTKNENNHLRKPTKKSLTKRKRHSFDQSDEDTNNVYPSEEAIKIVKTEETVNTNIVNVKQLKQDKDQQFLQQQSIEQTLSQHSKVQQSFQEYSQHETPAREETQSPQPLHINEDNNRCEDTIFGELITAVLKKMDLENKKRVKKEIMNIIFG